MNRISIGESLERKILPCIGISLSVIVFIFTWYWVSQIPTELLNEQMPITVGDFFEMMFWTLVLTMMLAISLIIQPMKIIRRKTIDT